MQYQGIEYDLKFKVLIVGEVAVGKTSLLRTLTGKEFKPGVMSTVGKFVGYSSHIKLL